MSDLTQKERAEVLNEFLGEILSITERADNNTYVITDTRLDEWVYDRDTNRLLYVRCPSKNEKDKKRAEMNKGKKLK